MTAARFSPSLSFFAGQGYRTVRWSPSDFHSFCSRPQPGPSPCDPPSKSLPVTGRGVCGFLPLCHGFFFQLLLGPKPSIPVSAPSSGDLPRLLFVFWNRCFHRSAEPLQQVREFPGPFRGHLSTALFSEHRFGSLLRSCPVPAVPNPFFFSRMSAASASPESRYRPRFFAPTSFHRAQVSAPG